METRQRETDVKLAAIKLHFTTDIKSGIPVIEMGRRLDGLSLIGVYPKDIIEEESYSVLPLDLKVRGTYVDILGFIQALESISQAMSVQALSIYDSQEQAESGDQVIIADMKLAFYGLKGGAVSRIGEDWTLGRFDIFSPALQDLLDAIRAGTSAGTFPAVPKESKPKTPAPAPSNPKPQGGATPDVVLPKEDKPEDIYSFPVK